MASLANGASTRMLAWMCLMVAITFEVVGTSFMASAARDGGYLGYLVMAAALAVSYYFLALSIRTIGVGVAYAIWEGLGLTLLTLVGVFIFKDNLSMRELMGLGIAVVGIVCVALGEEH
ncbi:DMT family transporter [Serratia sp. 22264]|uniref:DMT family transporter n=1 Tax=Serratia sp. 22264 TaxID=3453897 RepID=UPI003F84BDB9